MGGERQVNALEQFTPLMDAVISHIHEGVILTDYKGKVLFHNPAADKLLGYPDFDSVHDIRETTGVDLQQPLLQAPQSGTIDAGNYLADKRRFEQRVKFNGTIRF